MVLRLEVIALKKLQECPYVVRYIHSGRQDNFNFLVMERLQDNLADLRKRTKTGRFSLATTLKIGIQMIDSFECTHKLGYIHRDVKPSNFVSGRSKSTKGRIFVIDFGLARKYRLPDGSIRPPRKSAGFRGTARYASINSHKSKELGRRDDLWSVLYLLVEFAVGSLPWRKIKDKDRIGELKEKYTNKELVKDLPKEFYAFMESLQKLGYADEPDYDGLRGLLLTAYQRENYPMDMPFDWDLKDSSKTPPTVQVTSLLEEKDEKVELYKEEIKKEKDPESSSRGGGKESREELTKDKEPEKTPSKCANCVIM
jgi:tau tubulin kinase